MPPAWSGSYCRDCPLVLLTTPCDGASARASGLCGGAGGGGRAEAPVVALAGDGAFLMTGLELITAASQKIAVAVFVLRDRELAQIAQFQDVALNRKACSVLPDYDLEGLCRGVGVEHLRLDRGGRTP